jgi:hypothetical protein
MAVKKGIDTAKDVSNEAIGDDSAMDEGPSGSG